MNPNFCDLSAAVTGSLISYAFGAWNDLLGFYLLTIAINYATGVAASMKEHNGFSGQTCFWGLIRKVLMLLIIMLAHRMDLLLDSQVIMTSAIYYYLANELLSITENYGRLGFPLPDQVKQVIQIFKSKGGQS